jgi:hypothetical protein
MPDLVYDGVWTSSSNTQLGTYPYINVKQTEAGHQDISDDTPGNEMRRWSHGISGTSEQWNRNGDREVRVQGNNFTVIVKDNSVIVQGSCVVEIHGNSSLHVYGDMYTQIDGSLNAVVNGDTSIYSAGEVDLTAGDDINITSASGDIYLNTQTDIIAQGNLHVHGKLTCDSIYSAGNITTNSSMLAYQDIQFFGNLTGPTAILGTMTSVLMTDTMNLGIFNTHIHPSPKGPTGTSALKFLGGA